MRIAIYTPYLNTLGGGEKYMLTVAAILAEENDVDVLLGSHLYNINIVELKAKLLQIHGIDLLKAQFVRAPIGIGASGIKRSLFLKKYDWFF